MLSKTERLQALSYALRVQQFMTDPRSVAALDVAERFAYGKATVQELEEARELALDAAREAREEAEGLERRASWELAALEEARWAAKAVDVDVEEDDLEAERESLRKAEEAEDEALAALEAWRVAWEASEYAWRVTEAAEEAAATTL